MRFARLVFVPAALAALAAGCGTASAPTWTPPTVTEGPTGAPQVSGPVSASSAPASSAPTASVVASTAAGSPGTGSRIEIKLTDALKMEPAAVTVPAGVPVTFVVTNTGALDHEFYVGDEQAQAAREQAMTGASSAPPDAQNLIGLRPGQTKELTITFPAPGPTLAGCHVAGHYLAGMKATITVR